MIFCYGYDGAAKGVIANISSSYAHVYKGNLRFSLCNYYYAQLTNNNRKKERERSTIRKKRHCTLSEKTSRGFGVGTFESVS